MEPHIVCRMDGIVTPCDQEQTGCWYVTSERKERAMSTYVFVHGAWHGSWCWDKVVPLLEQAGHQVEALDLPGNGQDKTPIREITLATYRMARLPASSPKWRVIPCLCQTWWST